MKTQLRLFLMIVTAVLLLPSCIEDGFDTSPSAQPQFSVEELDMGVQFTENPSPTAMLKIYNRNSKQISLQDVRFREGEYFRMNVDGHSGKTFTDVDIRPNDSIYVFVEVTLPQTPTAAPLEMTDWLDVTTNGVVQSVVVKALAQNVERHRGETIRESTTWSAELPHVVFDTLRVAPGATLTLAAGCQLLFHDKAVLQVDGTLKALGTAEEPIVMRGDRTGNVVADISFDVMSNQWEGVRFGSSSQDNRLEYTDIANTCGGLRLDSLSTLTMVNSRLTNSGSVLLEAANGTKLRALNSEFSNAASALLLLGGGEFDLHRCTIANWYLFKWPDMAIIEFTDPENTHFDAVNSVIYGRDSAVGFYGEDVTAYDIWFRRCIFAVSGEDDERYINCIWETDPLLDYSLTDYVFPYTPLPESPVLNAADTSLDPADLPATDRRGLTRTATLGAYEPLPEAD